MAKRKTLRRQRDKALAELKQYKLQFSKSLHKAFQNSEYERRARRFTAYNLMTRGMMEDARYRPKANEVIRRLLHEMVDQGYLDECVRVYAASEHFDTQIRNQIELTVIQPEDNYDTGIFLQIYGNNE